MHYKSGLPAVAWKAVKAFFFLTEIQDMSNSSRRVAPLHTNRHCYATQNVTLDGSSTFQINVILQFARMCVCVFMVCTLNVLGLFQLGRR